jgi:hypothetical protein
VEVEYLGAAAETALNAGFKTDSYLLPLVEWSPLSLIAFATAIQKGEKLAWTVTSGLQK